MQLKRVRITAREVHDGLGGRYGRDETPTLPADVAVIIVSRKMAVYEDEEIAEETPDEPGDPTPEASEGQTRKKRERRK